MNEEYEIITNTVEFDEELYQQNLKENNFDAWKDAEVDEGIGTDITE